MRLLRNRKTRLTTCHNLNSMRNPVIPLDKKFHNEYLLTAGKAFTPSQQMLYNLL